MSNHVSRRIRDQHRRHRLRARTHIRQKEAPAIWIQSQIIPFHIPFHIPFRIPTHITFLDPHIPSKYSPYFCTQTFSLTRNIAYIRAHNHANGMMDSWKKSYDANTCPALQPTFFFHNELQKFLGYYSLYMKLRFRMKQLYYHWNLKRMMKKKLNSEDPFTLLSCTQPIRLYDTRMKGYWEFEASALKDYMCSKIMYHEELILEPQMPRHPLTNVPFNLIDLRNILPQFYQYQMMPWIFTVLLEYGADLNKITEDFSLPIKKQCLQTMCKDTRDQNFAYLFQDFLTDHFDFHNIQNIPRRRLITWIVQEYSKEPYGKGWVCLFIEYYTRLLMGHSIADEDPDMILLYKKSEKLIYSSRLLNMYRSRYENALLRL